jgi:hypothetical protein
MFLPQHYRHSVLDHTFRYAVRTRICLPFPHPHTHRSIDQSVSPRLYNVRRSGHSADLQTRSINYHIRLCLSLSPPVHQSTISPSFCPSTLLPSANQPVDPAVKPEVSNRSLCYPFHRPMYNTSNSKVKNQQ